LRRSDISNIMCVFQNCREIRRPYKKRPSRRVRIASTMGQETFNERSPKRTIR
jgi:hypothetical protein